MKMDAQQIEQRIMKLLDETSEAYEGVIYDSLIPLSLPTEHYREIAILDQRIGERVIAELESIGSQQSIDYLVTHQNDLQDDSMKVAAVFAMGKVGVNALEFLIESLKSDEPSIWWVAVYSIARIGEPSLDAIPVNEFLLDNHWVYNVSQNHPGGQRNEFRNHGGSFRQYRRGL